jgi:iron complex transport system substrate-binding protein
MAANLSYDVSTGKLTAETLPDMQLDRRQAITSAIATVSAITAPWALSSAAHGQDRIVIDAIGLQTRLAKPAERVVITSHYNYEDFTAIAGPEGWTRVVGMAREPWEGWRAADYAQYAKVIPSLSSIADVGGKSDFDADKVLKLKPDVVICDAAPDHLIGDQLQTLRRADVPIVFVDFQSESLRRHLASTYAIGRVMGTEARAGDIAKLYEATWQDVMERASVDPQWSTGDISCYVELAETGPDTIGFTEMNRLWGGMAQKLGVRNIARDVPDYGGPLPREVLFSEDPDFIFFAGSSWPTHAKGVRTGFNIAAAITRSTLLSYAARPGYEALKAVKASNLHTIEHNLAWSLRDVYAMQYMAKQFYSKQFEDIDPMRGLAGFHARFMPVPLSGTWFASLK